MNREAEQILAKIHRNKRFHPTERERHFLEDMSLNLVMGKIVSDKEFKILQKVYRKSQGG